MNPRDPLRRKILHRLYELHENGVENELRDVFAAQFVENNPKATEARVIANLRYLILKGWAKSDESGVAVSISAEGIDLMEGATFHQLPKGRDYLNVNLAGDDYAFIGEGDLVIGGREELFRAWGALREGLIRSRGLSRREKLDAAADIKALQSLLQKREPNPAAMKSLWTSARELCEKAGLDEEIDRAEKERERLELG
jgi:hypothetical protein